MPVGAAVMGWRAWAAVAGAVVLVAVVWKVQDWRYGARIAQMEQAQAETIVAAVEAARDEERRRLAVVESARDDAQKQAAAAAADAAGARAERDRLRARTNALAQAAAARDPALADGSATGTAPADLLAYMLERAIDRAEALAGVADRARIAGLTCERIYDEVRAGQMPASIAAHASSSMRGRSSDAAR